VERITRENEDPIFARRLPAEKIYSCLEELPFGSSWDVDRALIATPSLLTF